MQTTVLQVRVSQLEHAARRGSSDAVGGGGGVGAGVRRDSATGGGGSFNPETDALENHVKCVDTQNRMLNNEIVQLCEKQKAMIEAHVCLSLVVPT